MKSIKILIVFMVVITACKTPKYPNLENGLYADIQTSKGDVLIQLYDHKMPMTVANFVSLVEGNNPKLVDSLQGKPFYDGLKFHRVIKNFMIQGGDPKRTGRGKAGYQFDDEFPTNEEGELIYKHNRAGVLSMANAGPSTNSSQFFITHKETSWLDGKHSIFGNVLEGQNVVDSIKQNDLINKIEIIRVGGNAKDFAAPSIFSAELDKSFIRKKERLEKIALAKELFQKKMGIEKAISTDSGLKILKLQEGKGVKVNPALPTTAHYTLFTTQGKKIDSSIDRGTPIVFTLNKDSLISGWKEGASNMQEGEKARLFIPSYLGYGSIGRQPLIQPNTDLIFEIEILKVGK